MGEAETEVKDMLNKEYKESLSIQEGLKLAVSALKKALGKEFSADRLDGAYISSDDKQLKRFKKEDFLKVK